MWICIHTNEKLYSDIPSNDQCNKSRGALNKDDHTKTFHKYQYQNTLDTLFDYLSILQVKS